MAIRTDDRLDVAGLSVGREIVRDHESGFDCRDQYTTIVRSKPAQMVLSHPKLVTPQR
jgi:hypothetical protein